MKDIEKIADYVIDYLREQKVSIVFVCLNCGYHEGHQIVYCPKCPGKMIILRNTNELELLKRHRDLTKSYYDHIIFKYGYFDHNSRKLIKENILSKLII
jgi:hypothetical protein